MKKIIKSDSPNGLSEYLRENPSGTWNQFKNENADALKALQETLRRNQGDICAYCEKKMETFHGNGHDDFRVEHFHPKKRPPLPPPNWDLDWMNLLGVCSGGNMRYVGNAKELFTHPDFSCDVPKEDKILTDIILNPLTDIQASDIIFSYDEDGNMFVDQERCPEQLRKKAENTINYLNLSPSHYDENTPPRLVKFRKRLVSELRNQIELLVKSGMEFEDALAQLSNVYYKSTHEDWPAFFSCIRWYLGKAAEKRLFEIGYFE